MAHRRAKGLAGQESSPTEQSWRERLEAWRRSGLSQAEFCRRQGLSRVSLSWWKSRIARQESVRPSVSPGTEWLAVRALPSATGEPGGEDGEPQLEVVLRGGRIVRVGSGFDASALLRLVQALESLPC
jgi:hypothetical protein